jgi:hypothetical protein
MPKVTRADKIRLAAQAAKQAAAEDTRDPAQREAARKEWAAVRKAAREAYLAKKDWKGILDGFKDGDGFYTEEERDRMVKDYANELIASMNR